MENILKYDGLKWLLIEHPEEAPINVWAIHRYTRNKYKGSMGNIVKIARIGQLQTIEYIIYQESSLPQAIFFENCMHQTQQNQKERCRSIFEIQICKILGYFRFFLNKSANIRLF